MKYNWLNIPKEIVIKKVRLSCQCEGCYSLH